jgi:hypothetical protein
VSARLVRYELAKVEPTMVELRELRIAVAVQNEKMRDATKALEKHRVEGKGAWKWVR